MKPFLDFAEKAFVITGAGSGIGKEIALLCYENGAKLLLLDKNEAGLLETAKQMVSERYMLSAFDLTEYEKIEEEVASAIDKLGLFSGFCHSAGFEYTLPIKSMSPKHYQDLFNVNTIAAFELARILSKKKYAALEGASFVFIASIMGLVGRPGLTGYSATKGALISGAKSMALELAAKNIRVNCVSPGTVRTELIERMLQNLEPEQREKRLGDFPLGIGCPNDVANLVAFLLSDRSKWITGTNIAIDGGYTAK
jgi:NAD(P)-dependent dehydrogenase (short-subunit alcohol dehydrogenase family)